MSRSSDGIEESVIQLRASHITRPSELAELRAGWDELFDRTGCEHVFLSYDWMAEWYERCASDFRLFVIAVYEDRGRLAAVAPFSIRRSTALGFNTRVLVFMGSTLLASDHLNILVASGLEKAAVEAIVEELIKKRGEWDYIELADADSDSLMIEHLRGELRWRGLREFVIGRPPRPYIALPLKFDDYLACLAHRVRKNFRRGLRALERRGEVRLERLDDAECIQGRFGELLKLHDRRLSRQGLESAFSTASAQAFHLGFLKRMGSRKWPRLYLLQVDGQTVASLYGFQIGKRFAHYQSGIDPDWEEFSVGMVMVGLSIQNAIEEGLSTFDFLRGMPAYKLYWTKQTRKSLTLRFFDDRLLSRAWWLKFALRNWAAQVKRSGRRAARAALAMFRHTEQDA